MAKKEKAPLSFSDFDADENLLNQEEEETQEDEQDEEESEEEEEEQEEEVEEKKKPKSKSKVTPKKVEKEEEPEEEEEEEEEETQQPQNEEEEEEQEEETQDDSEQASKFFEQVEKITGREVEVDYGNVSPLSPQGVALREKALVDSTLDSWLEEIETKFPQVFQALQYANNGGDPAELFTQTTSRDYTRVELKEDDTDLAKQILKEYYQAKGVKSEEKIKKLIETDEDSESGIVKEAQSALAEMRTEQEEQRNQTLTAQKAKADEQKKRDTVLVTAIDEVLESRQLGSFKIIDKMEARQFKDFVLKNVRRTGEGKYEFATPVDATTLQNALQYQFFQYKGGDLSKIIQQKAASENAAKLKLKLKSEQGKVKKNTTEEGRTTLSLKDF